MKNSKLQPTIEYVMSFSLFYDWVLMFFFIILPNLYIWIPGLCIIMYHQDDLKWNKIEKRSSK